MQYFKTMYDNTVAGISTVNASGNGNITEEEYNNLRGMFLNMPRGKKIIEENGTYSYVDAPSIDPEPTVEDKAEAYDILTGGAS